MADKQRLSVIRRHIRSSKQPQEHEPDGVVLCGCSSNEGKITVNAEAPTIPKRR